MLTLGSTDLSVWRYYQPMLTYWDILVSRFMFFSMCQYQNCFLWAAKMFGQAIYNAVITQYQPIQRLPNIVISINPKIPCRFDPSQHCQRCWGKIESVCEKETALKDWILPQFDVNITDIRIFSLTNITAPDQAGKIWERNTLKTGRKRSHWRCSNTIFSILITIPIPKLADQPIPSTNPVPAHIKQFLAHLLWLSSVKSCWMQIFCYLCQLSPLFFITN